MADGDRMEDIEHELAGPYRRPPRLEAAGQEETNMHGAAGLVAEANASRTGFEAKATRAREPLTAPAASPAVRGPPEVDHQAQPVLQPRYHRLPDHRITGYRLGEHLCFFDGPIPSSSALDLLFDAGCRSVTGGSIRRERLSWRRGDCPT